MIAATFEALRYRQWTKNLILFAPLLFAQRALDPAYLLRAAIAFLVFCGLSGAIYIVNDLKDRDQDRRHPAKKFRPFASGRLSARYGLLLAGAILVAALGTAYALDPGLTTRVQPTGHGTPPLLAIGGREPSLFSLCGVYIVLFLLYSTYLKHVVILDALIVALGFVLRAVAGAAAVRVDISQWLLLCTIFLALFLSLAKRRHEIVLLEKDAANHRRSLGEYDVAGLDQLISIVAAVTLVAYALYTVSEDTLAKFGTARLSLTIPFVIYGLFRYIHVVRRHEHGGDPSQALIDDRPLLATVALWGSVVAWIIYA